MALDKLKEIRIRSSMTCQQVADKVGISKEYYWMIEKGQRRLTYENAVKIAKVFKKRPDQIFLNKGLTTGEQENKQIS